MTEHDRLVMLAISMSMVALVAIIMWLQQWLELRRLHRSLSETTVIKMFCKGKYFDLAGLLRVCGLSARTREVHQNESHYMATICGSGRRIRLTLRETGGCYTLERIERYIKTPQRQLVGWYAYYQHYGNNDEVPYTAIGEGDLNMARERHRLPEFFLTPEAIRILYRQCG